MQTTLFGYGVTSVSSQAEVVPDSQPRRGPPKATGDSRPSCARRGQRNATGQQNQQIRVMHWNARGLKRKKQELMEFLRLHEIDVCAIQETHLQEKERFWVRGYETFRQDRLNRKNGGISQQWKHADLDQKDRSRTKTQNG